MNITAQALVFAVTSVATAAAIGTGLGDFSAQPNTGIVKLERVVVVGKRADTAVASAQIVQLPRVVVTGHRVEPEVQLATSL